MTASKNAGASARPQKTAAGAAGQPKGIARTAKAAATKGTDATRTAKNTGPTKAGKAVREAVATVGATVGTAAKGVAETAAKVAKDVTAKAKAARSAKSDASKAPTLDRLAICVVTYKRQELLAGLFDSLLKLETAPWRIVVVDNEASERTERMVADLNAAVAEKWGKAGKDDEGGTDRVVYAPQEENLGGSGGFSAGVRKAYGLGAEWFWVMDDDVAVEPDGIDKLAKWSGSHDVIQGSRYDYDGGPFYWQYHFIVPLGIPDPIAPAAFGPAGYRVMNTMCFEGGLFRRRVVEKIGFPDPRFFIYWDDTIYGYLASKVTNPIVIPDMVMRRTREIGNWDIAGLRQLNSTSDMNRYHIMRNRGYMARYFMAHGDYRPFLFAVGTLATFAKELIRLGAVDRTFRTGIPALIRGWWDSRKLLHDPDWKPMPPLK